MRYVIVGNSAAGVSAAENIRKYDATGDINIFTDEKYPAYARCLTSHYLAGNLSESMMNIRDQDFYQRNNIQLHLNEKVTDINVESKTLTTGQGKYHYDKLLIATGASSYISDGLEIKKQGVFGLRTLDDAKNITHSIKSGDHAVVIGAGLVGLEAAYSLIKAGIKVTVVESSDRILSQMLDREAAEIVNKLLESKGINIKLNTGIEKILTTNDVVCGVKLTSGLEIPAQAVIIGTGIKPNVKLVQGTGMAIERGIIVNQYLETSVKDIYAAGDVAQAYDRLREVPNINGMWPNAVEQGSVAGKNMSGIATVYDGSIVMNSVDFFDLSIIAAGLAKEEGPEYQVAKSISQKGLYRRLVFKGDYLVGYILVGDTQKAGILTTLIKERVPLGKEKEQLTEGKFRQKALW